MDRTASAAEQLAAALLAFEGCVLRDLEAGHATAVDFERQATQLGDEQLLMRARLCRADVTLRFGDLAGAVRQFHEVHRWAVAHGDRRLQARAHLNFAILHQMSGDVAKMLENSVSAVELLDETATPHMQVWHRVKLADALANSGDMDAARSRYRQAEQLARELGMGELLNRMLNNWAYSEHMAGDVARAGEIARQMQEFATAFGLTLDSPKLDTIGAIQIANGEFAQAEQTMQVCIARYKAGIHEDADELADYFLTLARAQRGLGAMRAAQESLDSSRALCTEGGLQDMLVRVYQEQAELHAARGEHTEAFATHKLFMETQEALRDSQQLAKAQTRQAMFEAAEAREDAERFREQARRDSLTGLRNRRYADEELPRLIAGDPDLTVAIADVDHFKRINDTLSHDVGDQVLIQVAKLLETELAAVLPEGFVARLGGEEFLLVLPATPVSVGTAQLDGIRQAISDYDWRGISGELPVTISIGVAAASGNSSPSRAAALAAADRNLYAAKRGGRNRVVAGTRRERRARAHRDRDAG